MEKINFQEDVILIVFNFIGTIYGKTFIQKFFFLLQNELLTNLGLDYIPYHYGPYSNQLKEIINRLKEKKLVSESMELTKSLNFCSTFKLSNLGKQYIKRKLKTINPKLVSDINFFVSKFEDMIPSEILRYVYEHYPNWTCNSLIKEEIL